MGQATAIEWTATVNADGSSTQGASWNPIRARRKDTGKQGWACVKVSPGCANCYAKTLNGRNLPECGTGLDYTVPALSLVDFFIDEKTLEQPLRWKRPRKIFVGSMTDLFGEFVPDAFIDRIFAVMALCPQHTFICLSKRSKRMKEYLNDPRRNRLILSEIRRVGDRKRREHMALDEAPRSRGKAGRRILDGIDNQSLRPSEGGIQNPPRVPADKCFDQRNQNDGIGTPGSVDSLQWANSGGVDNQPHEWGEGRQSVRKSGTGDYVGATQARDLRAEREPASAKGVASSENAPYRAGCIQDQGSERKRADDDGNSGTVFDESEGHFRDLHSKDMEAYQLAWPLLNLWLGVSVEDQQRADERIPDLLAIPAAVRWVSYEPALGPVDFTRIAVSDGTKRNALTGEFYDVEFVSADRRQRGTMTVKTEPSLDWVIVGGESGPGARPFNIAWARNTIRQCRESGVAVFVKQMGAVPMLDEKEWRHGVDTTGRTPLLSAKNHTKVPAGYVPLALKNRKGGDMAEWAENLRVREFPEVRAGCQ